MSTDAPHDRAPSIETLLREARGEIDHSLNLGMLPNREAGALFTSKRDPIRLVTLVAAVTHDAHTLSTAAIIEGLEATLGESYSSGTVHPVLHALHDEGLLSRIDLQQTKPYSVGNPDAVDEALAGFEAELAWYLDAVRNARDELADLTETDADAESTNE